MSNLSGRGQLTGFMRSGGGGGGSEVVINPSGAATGTMEKISVDGDIYEVRNVPDATGASNGDVLTRSASGVGWYSPTKELPVYTSSDNNKVLAINNDTLTWKTIPKELPNILTSDEGKVLTVSNGVPSWQEEGGGGEVVVLYNGDTTTTGIITLSQSYRNFKTLTICAGASNENNIVNVGTRGIELTVAANRVINLVLTNSWLNFTMNSDTEFNVTGKTVGHIYQIIGIK